jgi:hypothetical protein
MLQPRMDVADYVIRLKLTPRRALHVFDRSGRDFKTLKRLLGYRVGNIAHVALYLFFGKSRHMASCCCVLFLA